MRDHRYMYSHLFVSFRQRNEISESRSMTYFFSPLCTVNSGSGAYLTLLPSPLPSPKRLTELRLQFQAQQFPALQMASLRQEAWISGGGSPSLSRRAEGHFLPSCPLHAYHTCLHLVSKNRTVREILRGCIKQKGSEGKK